MRTSRRRFIEIMRRGLIKGEANSCRFRFVTAILVLTVVLETIAGFVPVVAQRASKNLASMTADQRIAHVLSRLTYGARPGDFERVKVMGVEAFINQQLDPDSIENAAVIAKLRRLPSLNMATPVIIEQYTPPKPVASPSPAPAKSPDEKSVAPKSIAENALNHTPQLSANQSMSA